MDHKFVWLELASDDVVVAKKFYAKLFGWSMDEGGGMVKVNVGARIEMGAEIKKNPGAGHIPSHWTPLVEVEDVKVSTEKAVKLGAKVLYEVYQLPDGRGYASTVLDPAGAPLSLWQGNE